MGQGGQEKSACHGTFSDSAVKFYVSFTGGPRTDRHSVHGYSHTLGGQLGRI